MLYSLFWAKLVPWIVFSLFIYLFFLEFTRKKNNRQTDCGLCYLGDLSFIQSDTCYLTHHWNGYYCISMFSLVLRLHSSYFPVFLWAQSTSFVRETESKNKRVSLWKWFLQSLSAESTSWINDMSSFIWNCLW